MVILLFVLGKYMLSCVSGIGCVDVIGDPAVVIAAGGFEFLGESILGAKVYQKIVKGKDD